MEPDIILIESKKMVPNEDIQKCENDSNDVRRNSLLYLFIKCVWDSKDGQRSGHEDQKLKNWLKSQNLDLMEENWSLSTLLDVRISPRIKLKAESDRRLYHEIMDLNDKRICSSLAFKLRKVLPLLIKYEDNAHCANDKGQTILHIFLKEYTDVNQKHQSFAVVLLLKTLIASGASLFTVDKNKQTPFYIATNCKNKGIMRTILSSLNVNECDKYGNTALHIVADSYVEEEDSRVLEHLDLIRTLVSKGADITRKNRKGETPIHLAAGKFYIEMLQFFVESNVDFYEYTNESETPLHYACKSEVKFNDTSRMIETINLLVSQDCVISAANESGYSPLHYAAEYGIVEVIEKLFELGALVDCRTTITELTPLHLASKGGRLENMVTLVRAGADVNAVAEDGTTPLFLATMFAGVECIRYLIDKGADVNHRVNLSKLSVLRLLFPEKFAVELMSDSDGEQTKKFCMVLENNFDAKYLSNFGITALHLAVLSNRVKVVEVLIKLGAEINFQSHITEWTALHIALMKKHLEIAQILLVSGADANCRGGINHVTPLYLVVMLESLTEISEKYPDSVGKLGKDLFMINSWWPVNSHDFISNYKPFIALLIDHGSDVNVREEYSRRTLLHLTTLNRDTDVMKMLLKSGAFVNAEDVDGYLPLHNILKYGDGPGLKLLLEFGADINDLVTSGMIVNREIEMNHFPPHASNVFGIAASINIRFVKSNEVLSAIIIEHAIKLNKANLPVAMFYAPLIGQSDFTYFHEQCYEEVIKLTTHRVDDLSLYNFLHANARRQRVLMQKFSDLNGLEHNFPKYITLIKAACCATVQRKPLVESAMIAWNQICAFTLPYDIMEDIFYYLSNRDLNRLILSASKTAIVEKK